jgi:hypothetical protein
VGGVLNIVGGLIIMGGTEVWVVFLSYTAYIFYCNMTSLCRDIIDLRKYLSLSLSYPL